MVRPSVRILVCLICFSMLLTGCSEKTASLASDSLQSPAEQALLEGNGTASDAELREFSDSLGRTVLLPQKLEKVALSGPLTQIYVFPLCPELIVGFSTAFSQDSQKFISQQYLSLPELGQLYGGSGTMNLEALLVADPDIVIDVGEAKGSMTEDFDLLAEQTGIPFVHIDATIDSAPAAYRKMGELLGDTGRSELLAEWCENALSSISDIMEKVDADSARKSVIYCLGSKGLNVLADGSYHAQIISLVANNAAVLDSPVPHGDGNEIDMEQLILWNPDVILFQHNSIYDHVAESNVWQQLPAIHGGNYHEIPCGPYGWISSPPAVQCYLGMLWLTDVLYPDYVDYDLQSEVTEYYKLFYDYELSNEDYVSLTRR